MVLPVVSAYRFGPATAQTLLLVVLSKIAPTFQNRKTTKLSLIIIRNFKYSVEIYLLMKVFIFFII